MPSNYFISGQYNVICDVCGFRFKANQIKHRWDGMVVCEQDWEERHPSDLFQAREEQTGVPFTRPEPTDTFVTVSYISESVGVQENDIPVGDFIEVPVEEEPEPEPITYSSTFTTGSDTNLESFGAPDWYVVYGGGGRTKVIASTDRVHIINSLELVVHGLTHSLIEGIDDYAIVADCRRATGYDTGKLAARCGSASSQTFYELSTDSNNDMVLTRYNGAVPSILKTTALTITSNAEMEYTLTVTGTNPVELSYSIDGNSDTYSDSHIDRLTSGPPGISIYRNAAVQADVWVDNYVVTEV